MASLRSVALFALTVTVLLAACDSILGPDTEAAAIEITAGRTSIDMVGDTVHLTAEVRNEGGDVIDGAPVAWTSRERGVGTVDSTGLFTAVANGEVWVVAQSGEVSDSAAFTIDSDIPCAPVGDLAIPDTIDASLAATDCDIEGWYNDVWRIQLTAARDITIGMTTDHFDAYLVLLDATGQVVGVDDDSGGNLNPSLFVELGAGTYYAHATSYSPGAVGEYRITTMEGAPPSPCTATATVAFPDTVAGATTTDGSCNYNGFYIDVWRLELSAATVVTMQVQGDFDMHMAVTDTLGWFIASGGGVGSGSWLEEELPAGSYDVWVGGRDLDVTGSYTLALKQGPAARYCPTEGSVTLGDPVDGVLADDDCYVWQMPSDGWELNVDDTLEIEIGLTTDFMYPEVLIADSTGQIIDIAFGDETSVRYTTTLLPGLFRLWVRSGDGETGAYTLSVAEEGQLGTCDVAGDVVMDSTYEGGLATTDCRTVDGRYADVYALQLDSATTATITLTSDKLDTYLIVADTLGSSIAEDDDSGQGTNSALTLDLDAGTYHVWATSYAAEAVGGYTLALATGSTALLTDQATTKPARSRPAVERPDPWGGREVSRSKPPPERR